MSFTPIQVGKRAKNFSNNEKVLLIELVADKLHIIENKKTDSNTGKLKREAWENIAVKFLSFGYDREAKCLSLAWQNLKRCTKKSYAESKKQTRGTGRRSFNVRLDPLHEKILCK